jgi:hypothetical protein
MTQLIADSTQNTARRARFWLLAAFIAGMVFIAVLVQTLSAVNSTYPGIRHLPGSSGGRDSPASVPAPDDNYYPDADAYRMVFTCTGPEGMLSG